MDDQNTKPQSDSQTPSGSSGDDPERWVIDQINNSYN